MRKVKYIILGFLFLASYSCQKECLDPSDPRFKFGTDTDWSTLVEELNLSPEDAKLILNGNNAPISGAGGVTITDPNNDPDVTRKKGRR